MGAALERVTVQHERANKPRTVRISRKVKQAIDLMVHEGKKRPEAAEAVHLTDDALRKALLKTDVLAYRNEQLKVLRTSAASRTIFKAQALMDSAESEHVQMKATEWVAGLDGIAPLQKSESTINHKGLGPGLIINVVQRQPGRTIEGEGRLIHSQPSQPRLISREKSLRLPVPHPARGTAPAEGGNHGETA